MPHCSLVQKEEAPIDRYILASSKRYFKRKPRLSMVYSVNQKLGDCRCRWRGAPHACTPGRNGGHSSLIHRLGKSEALESVLG